MDLAIKLAIADIDAVLFQLPGVGLALITQHVVLRSNHDRWSHPGKRCGEQRRCINLLVKSLERALRRSTGLVELHITTAAGTMREEDVTRLVTAAALGWRERQRTVLLGTHADCDSPLRRLPNAIVRQILEYAEGVGRANVVVRAEASAAPPHPPAPPHPAGGGHDLNFVAMLI